MKDKEHYNKLIKMSLDKLLSLWYKNLKLAFIKTEDGKIIEGNEEAYRKMGEVDKELRRREGGTCNPRSVGYHRRNRTYYIKYKVGGE